MEAMIDEAIPAWLRFVIGLPQKRSLACPSGEDVFVILALPDNFSDCKQKKKGLVKKVQAFLAQCDTVEGSIGQEMDKLQSKNMALAE